MIWKKYLTACVWLLSLAVIGGALLWYESELLWKAQEMNLFLCSWLFLKQQMVVAGGLLTWLGTWFTQFFFHPWQGVLLLCAWWLLLMWLSKRAFRVPDRWGVVLLVPVALLLLTIVDTGYWLYVLKLRGHFFVSTIGTTAVVALLWAFRCVPSRWLLRPLFIVVSCVVGYPLLGAYGLAATLIMGVMTWKLSEGKKDVLRKLVDSVVAVLSVVTVPLLCYRYVYHETGIGSIYRVELPLYKVTESCPNYYIPYILLGLFFVALALVFPMKKGEKSPSVGVLWKWGVVIVALAAGVYQFWFKDENFHHELSMMHSIDKLDWKGVVDEAAKQEDEPTRAIVMMRNLALTRLGRQGNEMYRYKNGSKMYDAPYPMRMLLVTGPLVYYHYGMTNGCFRLCMEMGVEFGWRAEHLKYMARCTMLDGEHRLTRKYLGLLHETMFFDQWAEKMEKLVGNDDAVRNDREMGFITHMMHYNDILKSDNGFVERFLMNQLSESRYADDPVFQEQTLLASLWTRDIRRFWRHLNDYIRLHPDKELPLHYQEAAILFGSLEERPDLDRWPFAPAVKDSYGRFREITPRYDQMEVDAVRKALGPLFGRTYYYEYYLMDNLPEY